MWTLPRFRHAASYVMDMDEFNTNMTQFANQVDGGLNEHNWANNALVNILTADKVDEDIALNVYNTKLAIDPATAVGSLTKLRHSTSWSPVTGASATFTSHGGKAMVFISFQLVTVFTALEVPPLNFAIGLDGVVQQNALLGTGDPSNDFMETGTDATVAGGQVELDFGTAPGFRGVREKLLVTGLIDIAPGQHTIQLFSRNLYTRNTATPPEQYIAGYEVIMLKMWH